MQAVEAVWRNNLAWRTRDTAQLTARREDTFPSGIQILHDPADATVDVCFIHGLSGDRRMTWTAEGQASPWPQQILPPRLPGARILTFGYNANVIPGRAPISTNRLGDHAKDLLVDLTNARAEAPHQPLIFVAHSMGGIVVKGAVLASRNNPEQHLWSIFECTVDVAFLATPHRGSWIASCAKVPAAALGLRSNKSLLDVLETDDQFLESIQERFLSMVREQRETGGQLGVACFHEELPLNGVGLVVSRESASLAGCSSISIHADHRQMARFASTDDNGFIRLLGELRRWSSGRSGSSDSSGRRLDQRRLLQALEARTARPESSASRSKEQSPSEEGSHQSPHRGYAMSGPGFQFRAPEVTQYINTERGTQYVHAGSGNQISGSTFHGPVTFGRC